MATPRRATSMLVAMGTALAFATILGPPVVGDAIVSLRPRTLAPLQVMDKVYARFGGRAGQWVVLSIDPDADAARRRSDRIAEALDALTPEGIVAGYDALATIEPSGSLAHERLAAFRSIDWSEVRLNLERALVAHGFDVTAFAPALDHLTSASPGVDSPAEAASDPGLAAPADRETFLTLLRARHLGSFSGRTAVATYVRVGSRPSDADEVRKAIASADPTAVVTGYPELERELRGSLARDLPRVGVVALLLVFVALRTALRRVRHVFVVIGTVAASFGLLSLAMRVANVELHVYDALVLPVLLGISVDEAVFLHEAVEQDGLRAGLAREGPLVLTTALTTASGFGALLVCDFPGLRDLGAVGALGSIAGLVATLIIVPAVARLAHEPDKPGSPLAEPRLLP